MTPRGPGMARRGINQSVVDKLAHAMGVSDAAKKGKSDSKKIASVPQGQGNLSHRKLKSDSEILTAANIYGVWT